jgi:TPP-dependent pyruvate/acetoin dehydrogenase alpha subunit
VVFFGDAATEEGVFCESLNFAALKKLPVIFVCENNLYSVYSPLSVRWPEQRDNLSIAKGYGIRAKRGDGNDVACVYKISKDAVSFARSGKGPVYLEFNTYRHREHCGHNFDNQIGYRSEAEFRRWLKKCPVDNFEKKLVRQEILNRDAVCRIKARIKQEIEQAVDFAKKSPFPKNKEIFTSICA